MKFLDLAGESPGVLFPEAELRTIIADGQFYEEKFLDFFRTVILAYASASRQPGGPVGFEGIERWIQQNYLVLRERLPADLKRLYLSEIAFPVRRP